jgi:hypothetical protein
VAAEHAARIIVKRMWFLNVLRELYGMVGVKHPVASLVFFIIVGAVLGGAFCGMLWAWTGNSYRKTQVNLPQPLHVEVSGDCSSGNSGNGNSTNISCGEQPSKSK